MRTRLQASNWLTVALLGLAGSPLALSAQAGPDFSISVSPSATSIAQGSSGSLTISATVSGGFNNTLTLLASGQPNGVTVTFSPSTIPAPGSGSPTMTFSVGSSITTGTFPITVIGAGGGTSRTATVSLTVTGSSSPENAEQKVTKLLEAAKNSTTRNETVCDITLPKCSADVISIAGDTKSTIRITNIPDKTCKVRATTNENYKAYEVNDKDFRSRDLDLGTDELDTSTQLPATVQVDIHLKKWFFTSFGARRANSDKRARPFSARTAKTLSEADYRSSCMPPCAK